MAGLTQGRAVATLSVSGSQFSSKSLKEGALDHTESLSRSPMALTTSAGSCRWAQCPGAGVGVGGRLSQTGMLGGRGVRRADRGQGGWADDLVALGGQRSHAEPGGPWRVRESPGLRWVWAQTSLSCLKALGNP